MSAGPPSSKPIPRPESEHSARARFVLARRLGGPLLRAWGGSWRLDRDLPPGVRALDETGEPYIIGFFHEHILSLAYAYRDRGIVVLVSQSEDGEYISQVIHALGYGTVRGSTSRGSLRALLLAARHASEGHTLGFTPDGPRGPRRSLQPGLLAVASRSGRPIVLLSAGVRPARRLKSWDCFEVPWPFARVRVFADGPILLPKDLAPGKAEESYGPDVLARLLALEERAEAFSRGGSR